MLIACLMPQHYTFRNNINTNNYLFQNSTNTSQLYYDKTCIDANVGGTGYTDTDIDNLLDLRVPKSDFVDMFLHFLCLLMTP